MCTTIMIYTIHYCCTSLGGKIVPLHILSWNVTPFQKPAHFRALFHVLLNFQFQRRIKAFTDCVLETVLILGREVQNPQDLMQLVKER